MIKLEDKIGSFNCLWQSDYFKIPEPAAIARIEQETFDLDPTLALQYTVNLKESSKKIPVRLELFHVNNFKPHLQPHEAQKLLKKFKKGKPATIEKKGFVWTAKYIGQDQIDPKSQKVARVNYLGGGQLTPTAGGAEVSANYNFSDANGHSTYIEFSTFLVPGQ